MVEIVQKLLNGGRIDDAFALCRFMYRVGKPIVSDAFYDKFEKYLRDNNLATEYLNRTYDDDPTPVALLREFGLESEIPIDEGTKSEYLRYLDEDKSLSIKAVTNYEEAYRYAQSVKGQDLIFTPKVDGINNKSLGLEGEVKLSLTRGRSGSGYDITENILKVMPRYYAYDGEIKIFSESFVETDKLELLRNKYKQDGYVTEKSSAISLLRVPHQKEDYQYLKVKCFMAEGIGTKVTEILDKLKALGFDTVPYMLVKAEEIPDSFEEFSEWLKDKLEFMWHLSQGIPTDGVVLEVNDLAFQGDIKNQYSSRNIALKMEQWSFEYFKGTVKEIFFEQNRVEASTRVRLYPMTTSDGSSAKVVNVFNPKILIENNILPDNPIYFERNSGAVNIMLHGDKLNQLLKGR